MIFIATPQDHGLSVADDLRMIVRRYIFLKYFQCLIAVESLPDIAFRHLSFLPQRPPCGMCLAIDFHENFHENRVDIPLSAEQCAEISDAVAVDRGARQQTRTVPPETPRPGLTSMPCSCRKSPTFRRSKIQYRRQADDCGDCPELARWAAFCHFKGPDRAPPAQARSL